MLRGYRLIIVASGLAAILIAFGLGSFVTALSYPKQDEGYQPYQSSRSKGPDAAFAIANIHQSIVHRAPCQNSQSETESDLCAQWRAARAAEKSAYWSMWGVIASIVGISLLLWQIMLTREALEDTGEATDAMRKANEITGEGQRAWLSLKFALTQGFSPGTTHLGVGGFYCEVGGVVKNHGHAPARHIRCGAEIRLKGVGELGMAEAMHAFCDDWRDRLTGNPDASIGPTLFASEHRSEGHTIFLPQGDIERVTAGQENKWIFPFVVGFISYGTPHAGGIRQTRFAYNLCRSKDGKPFVIDAGEDAWWAHTIQVEDHEIIEAD